MRVYCFYLIALRLERGRKKKKKEKEKKEIPQASISGIKQHCRQAPDRVDTEYMQPPLPHEASHQAFSRSQNLQERRERPFKGETMDGIPKAPLTAKPNIAR